MENSNVPKIRFKGFTNAWVQRKLSDIAYIFDGTHQTPKYVDEGVRFVSVENINDIENVNKFISKDDFYSQFKNKPERGDIFMTRITAGVIGATAIVKTDEALAYYVSLALIKPTENVKTEYLNSYIATNGFKIELDKRIIHTAFPKKINLNEIGKCVVSFPYSEEQIKIGKFFQTLDDTIILYKRKLDGLKELKKGYLQQILPQAGECVPRIRFAGFSEPWEQRRLCEMLTERNEQMEESKEYPLMSFVGNVGVVPKGEQYDRSFLVKDDNKKYKKTLLNDFIYSSNNLETGSIGFNKTGNAVISPVYSIFYSNNDSESQFIGLLSMRKDFINKMIHFRQGVMYGQWRIHEKDFLKITVITPSLIEQNKIIQFFRNLDEQIATQQTKLDKLSQLKAAYLHKMFV